MSILRIKVILNPTVAHHKKIWLLRGNEVTEAIPRTKRRSPRYPDKSIGTHRDDIFDFFLSYFHHLICYLNVNQLQFSQRLIRLWRNLQQNRSNYG
jgi:hypothetical protein